MAQPETQDKYAGDTAAIQLKDEGAEETVMDEIGFLRTADGVHAIAGNVTDARVRQLLQRELVSGKKRIVVDLNQVEVSQEVLAQLEVQQHRLHERGVTLSILVGDAADVRKPEVKGMQAREGVEVVDHRHAGEVLRTEGGSGDQRRV